MEAGRREETGKLEGESGSRRSMLMVRQLVVVMLWGRGREREMGRRGLWGRCWFSGRGGQGNDSAWDGGSVLYSNRNSCT